MHKYLLVYILSVFVFYGNAQNWEPYKVEFNLSNGLPTNTIYKLLPTDDGLVWMATEVGLIRYDGLRFDIVGEMSKSKSVFGLCQMSENLLVYHDLIGNIYTFSISEEKETRIYKEANNNTFVPNIIAFNRKVYVQTRYNSHFILNDNGKQIFGDKFFSLHSSNMLIYDDKVLCILNGDIVDITNGRPVPYFEKVIDKNHVGKLGLRKLANGFLLSYGNMKTNQMSFKFLKNKKYQNLNLGVLNNLSVIDIFEEENQLYSLTSNGLIILKNDGTFDFAHHYFKGTTITDYAIDQYGNTIISTLNDGLYIISNTNVFKLSTSNSQNTKITALEVVNDTLLFYITNHEKLSQLNLNQGWSRQWPIQNQYNQFLSYNPYDHKLVLNNGFDQIEFDIQTDSIMRYNAYNFPKDILYFDEKVTFKTFSNGLSKIVSNKPLTLLNGRYTEMEKLPNKKDEFLITGRDTIFAVELSERDFRLKSLTSGQTFKCNDLGHCLVFERGALKFYRDIENQNEQVLVVETGLGNRAFDINDRYIWYLKNNNLIRFSTADLKYSYLNLGKSETDFNVEKLHLSENYIWANSKHWIYRISQDINIKESNNQNIYLKELELSGSSVPISENIKLLNSQDAIYMQFHTNGYGQTKGMHLRYRLGDSETYVKLGEGQMALRFSGLNYGKQKLLVEAVDNFNGETIDRKTFVIYNPTPFYKSTWFWLVVLTIAALISLYIVVSNSKKRAKSLLLRSQKAESERALIELQLENLRSQMNPHFIFNTLNTLQEFILSKEPLVASNYLVKFSKLMRRILDQSQQQLISIEEEIITLKLYLDLEKKRFDNNFNYDFQIDESINVKKTKIPSLLLQPFVENAVIHGLLNKKQNRCLSIIFKDEEYGHSLKVQIVDNGIGREQSSQLKLRTHKSFAISAMRKRLDLIGERLNRRLDIEITNATNNNIYPGTRVEIRLPKNIEAA